MENWVENEFIRRVRCGAFLRPAHIAWIKYAKLGEEKANVFRESHRLDHRGHRGQANPCVLF